MHLMSTAVTALAAAATLGATATIAGAQSCQDLWIERNLYYKLAGYCFKTARAISYFGNDGCRYRNESQVPLPDEVRARIIQITRLERAYRCPR